MLVSIIFILAVMLFGDVVWAQLPKETPPLELQPLIQEALARNPEILAARQQWQASTERIPQAKGLPDPTLGVQFWNFPQSFNLGQTQNTILTFAQSLPFPGKLGLQGEVASRGAAMNQQAIAAKEREIVARVKQAYYDLYFAQKDLQIHHDQVDLIKQLFEIATAKFRAGKVTQVDVLKAQVELSDLYQRLPVIEQRVTTAEARINALLDREALTSLAVPREPPGTRADRSLEELDRVAGATRPELVAADLGIQRSRQARALAERQFYPDFQVAFQRFQNYQAPDGFGAVATVTVPFALWTKPKYDAGIREAKAVEAAARASHHNWQLMTRFQIRDLTAQIHAQQQVADLYRTTLIPQGEHSLQAALAGYRTGRNDFLDLVAAERTLLDFRLAYYRALVEREKQSAILEQVIGSDL